VLLLAPSGGGKSTLLAALAGLHDPESSGRSEGTLLVDGRHPRDVRARTGLVLQDPEAQVVMARAGDDVAFGLENRGVPREQIWQRVDAALAAVGFPYGPDRSTAALSGGEQQRLALAGVLALRPGLLLLDEPTAQLDPAGAAVVREVVHRVRTPPCCSSSTASPTRSRSWTGSWCWSREAAWWRTARRRPSSPSTGPRWPPAACGCRGWRCRAGAPPVHPVRRCSPRLAWATRGWPAGCPTWSCAPARRWR
jgi:ABC-type uncharacterized transport system YnjBCD ATPase subunit